MKTSLLACSDYLFGTKFSSGLLIKVVENYYGLKPRKSFLIDFVKNKTVVHVGFADHIPLIERKMANQDWLHALLHQSSKKCIGIDVDDDAIELMRSKYPQYEVYKCDLLSDHMPPEVSNANWDVVLLGEVLEHIDNPVNFLTAVREKLGSNGTHFVVTVPNAFDLQNLKQLRHGQEYINTDHRFWFTPYTLAKVGARAGLKIVKMDYCHSTACSGLRRWIVNRYPLMREGLIATFIAA